MIVRMWEARGHPDRFADLVTWVCDTGVPSLELDPGHVASEVFASADHRVVVISRWRFGPRDLPRPPSRLVARDPHGWDFTPVDR